MHRDPGFRIHRTSRRMKSLHLLLFITILSPTDALTWPTSLWQKLKNLISENSEGDNVLKSEASSEVEASPSVLWGIPDTQALVGRVFTYQIPVHAFSGPVTSYEVKAAGSAGLPLWLYFNTTTGTFLGLPTPADLGYVHITVKALGSLNSTKSPPEAAFVIAIHTPTNQISGLLTHDPLITTPLKLIDSKSSDSMSYVSQWDHSCAFDENVNRATLVLDASISDLPALERVKLVSKMAAFLGKPVSTITLSTKKSSVVARLLDTHVLVAGPGDADHRTTQAGVELTWVLGCDNFKQNEDVSRVIEHNIQSGRIFAELGHRVIGWHVTETQPPEVFRAQRRLKRQAAYQTQIPTETLATGLPTRISSIMTTSFIQPSPTVISPTLSSSTAPSQTGYPYKSISSSQSTITTPISITPTPILPSVTSTLTSSTISLTPSITPSSVVTTAPPTTAVQDNTTPSSLESVTKLNTNTPTTAKKTSVVTTLSTAKDKTTVTDSTTRGTTTALTSSGHVTTGLESSTESTSIKTVVPKVTTQPTTTKAPTVSTKVDTALTKEPTQSTPVVTSEITTQVPPDVTTKVTAEFTSGKALKPTTQTTDEITSEVTTKSKQRRTTKVTTQATPRVTTTVTTEILPGVTSKVTTLSTSDVTSKATTQTKEVTSASIKTTSPVTTKTTSQATSKETTSLVEITSQSPNTTSKSTPSPSTQYSTTQSTPPASSSSSIAEGTYVPREVSTPKSPPLSTSKQTSTTEQTANKITTTTTSLVTFIPTEVRTTGVIPTQPSTTASAAASINTTTTAPARLPPRLLNPIRAVPLLLGTVFTYVIPADTFYDDVDGDTRDLQLTLTTGEGHLLTPDFWLTFDPRTQSLTGIPMMEDIEHEVPEFVLTAINAAGLETTDTFHVLVNVSVVQQISHQFIARFGVQYENILLSRMYLINVLNKLGQYFGDGGPSGITVLEVSRGSLQIEWFNNTVSKTVCDNMTLTELFATVSVEGQINPAFHHFMAPDFPVTAVDYEWLGVCEGMEKELHTEGHEGETEKELHSLTTEETAMAVLIPALIIVLLLACVAVYVLCFRDPLHRGSFIIDDKKLIFGKSRAPVVLDDEMEMNDPVMRRPKKPTVMPTDNEPYTYSNPALDLDQDDPYMTSRGEPPPYKSSPQRFEYEEPVRAAPPQYFPRPPLRVASGYDTPPPAYRLPPPYLNKPRHSEI